MYWHSRTPSIRTSFLRDPRLSTLLFLCERFEMDDVKQPRLHVCCGLATDLD